MRGVSFALTALDVRMVEPAGFDLHLPEWLNTPPAKVPVVRLFGVSRQGASVCVHVHGSWPFFLCRAFGGGGYSAFFHASQL
mmetsp:Transcript_70781/g.165787  ORF Transcript_70781/g.165787 Transcript_70781/m.165787 type:complete len:82 (+) Transcript_70781:61-306(+)